MSGKAGPSDGAPLDGDRAAHGNAVAEGVATAISWLTIVPMRGAAVFDRITGRRAMAAAPVAGLVPGLGAVLVAFLVPVAAVLFDGAPLGGPIAYSIATAPLIAVLSGALIVCAAESSTRAMHIDGLADVADALGSYRDPDGAREILRAPDTGPMGSATVTLTLLAQTVALSMLANKFAADLFPPGADGALPFLVLPSGEIEIGSPPPEAALPFGGADVVSAVASAATLLLPFVIGRAAATAACHRSLPPMSQTGFGSLVAGTQPTWAVAAWWVPLTVVSGVFAGAAGVIACAAALVFAIGFGRVAVRRLGGVNGDVLGATVQVSTLIAAVFLALG